DAGGDHAYEHLGGQRLGVGHVDEPELLLATPRRLLDGAHHRRSSEAVGTSLWRATSARSKWKLSHTTQPSRNSKRMNTGVATWRPLGASSENVRCKVKRMVPQAASRAPSRP